MELRALCDSCGDLTLGDIEVAAFRNLQIRMQSGVPRTISATPPDGCICVFTDGACEGPEDAPVCSIGGVMYDRQEGQWCTRFFSCSVPAGIIRRWSDTGKKHLIGPVELYAVVCARRVWGSFLNHARVLIFVDHSGVHAACVSGTSKDPVWRSLLIELECADADAMMGWIARVPSPSNPADAPSALGGMAADKDKTTMFKLTLSMEGPKKQQIREALTALSDSAALRLIGARLRPERSHRQLPKELQAMIQDAEL